MSTVMSLTPHHHQQPLGQARPGQPDPTPPPRGAYPCVTFVTVPSSATWTLSLAALRVSIYAICSRASLLPWTGRAAWAYLSGLKSMVIASPSFTTRVSLGRSDFAKVWCVAGHVSSTASRLRKPCGDCKRGGNVYGGSGGRQRRGERGWTNYVVAGIPELLAHELVLPVGCLVLAAVFGHEAWDYERHGC